ncbi:MAG: PstS family phosphate ABC transporter substrate-binding protein [Aigarchaeota archaeon]|nr:PstS family phosphate ABC transporter substrate-binding protein [Aigarchaeota archaeon]MDW8093017.1 PstS family phosphate ABC transporter substrate-binding protein [Nitrososphaerota archaeon]
MSERRSSNAILAGLLIAGLLVGLVVGAVISPAVVGTGETKTVTTTVVGAGGQQMTVTRTVTERVGGGATVTVTVTGTGTPTRPLSGEITIDGSSTVYPITEAVAEAFMKEHPGVKITVGISGTGGGFRRFVIGETDINDASRPITRSEADTAATNNVRWIEIPVAIDGLVVVVNRANTWVDCLTISELRELWKPDSRVRTWRDLRAEWPNERIVLYGPGPDSGTFDYFTERVNGRAKASRTDYIASEDDNVLVAGVEGERLALGYFGYAYYEEAKGRIKVIPVRDDAIAGSSCVTPVDETISSFTYPLSRPLFIYVNKKYWDEKPHLRAFVLYYVEKGEQFVKKVKYTPFPTKYYSVAHRLLAAGETSGLFSLTNLPWREAGPR